MIWTASYVALIALVNYGFSIVPLVMMPTGEMWPPMSLAVGLVFVVRDFAQQEVGHRIWIAMLVGALLSWWMASPFIALASAAAFLISEAADWAVYSYSKRPVAERILLSSAVSSPIDSVAFLTFIGHLSVSGVIAMVVSKMVGALVVAAFMKRGAVA